MTVRDIFEEGEDRDLAGVWVERVDVALAVGVVIGWGFHWFVLSSGGEVMQQWTELSGNVGRTVNVSPVSMLTGVFILQFHHAVGSRIDFDLPGVSFCVSLGSDALAGPRLGDLGRSSNSSNRSFALERE